MYDIFYVSKGAADDNNWKQFKLKYPTAQKIENASSFEDIKRKAFTQMFWVVWDDLELSGKFDITEYQATKWDDTYVHVFKNGEYYDGVCLFSKKSTITKKEFDNRFFSNKKEVDVIASTPKSYDIFNLNSYEEYKLVVENTTTPMFWVVFDNIEIVEDFKFDYQVPFYNQHITHIFKNGDFFDGVCLFSKKSTITKKEFDNRFFSNKKEVDVIASTPKSYDIFNLNSYEDYTTALEKSNSNMFWVVFDNIEIVEDFKFDYQVPFYNQHITHIFKNGDFFDGVCLFSKYLPITEKEFDNRFFISKKEIDIIASFPKKYDAFIIDTFEDYESAVNNSNTLMFWAIFTDIEIVEDFKFDYQVPFYNQHITHIFKNGEYYDGVCLFSKNLKITKKEFDYRFFISKKEIDIIASFPKKYDAFIIDTFEDYTTALEKSKFNMFWIVPNEIQVDSNFKFDLYFSHHNTYDRTMNHVFGHSFRNEKTYNGVMLMSKKKPVSAKEIKFRFLIEKKEYDPIISKLKDYDIVFISYNEPNAEENYNKLLDRFPRAKRVHGVKGIHNAHIEAAKLCTTDMIWIVDGDSIIEENFNFNYEVSRYELDIVHVWRSRNPVNNLEYGNGGVKLLPRLMTLNMDIDTADMTTSISKRFKAMGEVSNINCFNTDVFTTWRSAFRECVKLSSRVIDRQQEEETNKRLDIWCTAGNGKFAEYSIAGAKAGRAYGSTNKENIDALKKINDFDWLKRKFDEV
jgi:hypothetical protein